MEGAGGTAAAPAARALLSPEAADLAYLAAAALFVAAIKMLARPSTAERANKTGALGMALAAGAALASTPGVQWGWVAGALAAGTAAGAVLALRVPMTAMPQMVALLNGFGGLASVLVGAGALIHEPAPDRAFLLSTAAAGLVGGVTFTGSMVAFDKLQEWLLPSKPVFLPGRHVWSLAAGVLSLALCAFFVVQPGWEAYAALSAAALILGVLLTLPVGGADMPVVIALLNSYSGMAAAATGFALRNTVLIVSGALVGASGIILVQIMCRAMNRSMLAVMSGATGGEASGGAAPDIYSGRVKSASAEEIAMTLEGARRIAFIPGYGMAAAQAQHAVRDLARKLETRGAEVFYAIHPVAGRMPGHMNVLLAEAGVPYEQLKDLDESNPLFEQTDAAIVIGANDTVNPSARSDPKSPLAGMPILDADKARTVIVLKRSLSPGFAGVPNPLFAAPNAVMFFEDGKKAALELIKALDELA